MIDARRVQTHFDHVAVEYDRWKARAAYYYAWLARLLREQIPPGARVLDLGCGTGTLLNAVAPARGVGVDLSPEMVRLAHDRFPHLDFRAGDAQLLGQGETFDYVLLVDVLEHLSNPRAVLEAARHACRVDGRVIVLTANPLWRPILHMAEALHLKMPEGDHRWLRPAEIRQALRDAGLAILREDRRVLIPKRIPLLSWLANDYLGRLPGLQSLCLILMFIASPQDE
jgi:2-polyprenyl-3-methyl-5-hydroxy-6-metoxy-1,4-benzoquinol methylase